MKKIIPAALAGGFFLSVTGQEALAATGQEVVNQADKFQGAQYVYGAPAFSTTEFDCSSFTQMIYQEAAGITLPRTAAEQATKGVEVSRSGLQPGDLLFFDTNLDGSINHVGIYIGNGQMISSELTYGVHITNVFSGGGAQSYWEPRFVTARRVINQSSAAVQPVQVSNQPVSQSLASVYTVKSGDSLWAIAQSHGVSVAAIKAANGLGSNMIYPGQKLKLSAAAQGTASVSVSAAAVQPAATVSNSPSSATGTVYTVKSGDNLWAIAQSHNTSVNALKNVNSLKSDMIYPGQKLKLSGSASASIPVEAKAVVKTGAPQSSSDGGSYHVEGGDSLWAIATLHGITVNKLMRANHLSSTLIYPGQNLVIPV
ncbi:LysM peptidoglycan-binding domain-containing protein [Sporolactobacillus pectinivorans]|uniref:LysM peptidoglycan-binding domain-containing protein n=1 Tax=Sporolactobacillus pectinivorans TaxID=1591408 RepID=UPI000C25F59A|nr:LysM peptidoglycan-binding domain-containing protein [Sporolactobacillus pectinivorans]